MKSKFDWKKGNLVNNFTTWASMFFIALILSVISCLITGIFVAILWNWLMPHLFGLPIITYWEGFGLALLCAILIKGFNATVSKET